MKLRDCYKCVNRSLSGFSRPSLPPRRRGNRVDRTKGVIQPGLVKLVDGFVLLIGEALIAVLWALPIYFGLAATLESVAWLPSDAEDWLAAAALVVIGAVPGVLSIPARLQSPSASHA